MEINKAFDALINIIKKAQGDRSLNQFALNCEVNAGHLSRILNGKFVNPPSPDFLRKISEHASNNVTYEDLMEAAGHTSRTVKKPTETASPALETAEEEKDIEMKLTKIKKDLEQHQGLMLSGDPVSKEAVQSILDAIEYGMKQAKVINKKYSPKNTEDK